MKCFISFVLLFILTCPVYGQLYVNTPVPKALLDAIHMVESGGRKVGVPKGDGGKARGPFQIHEAYWKDAIGFNPNIKGKYEDCDGYEYSVKVVTAYMNRYASTYIRDENFEAIARIHNGGPNGHRKQSTERYWERVKQYLYYR